MSDLETRPVGGGVLQATVVGIGCNNFGRRLDAAGATARVVLAALEEGITFFDTADIYGDGQSEEMLGAALKGRREEAVIATKFGHPSGGEGRSGASRRWIRIAVEDSLRRLDTDWIDLYQMHTPDPATPDRGNARDAHRARQRGQDPVRRLVEPGGLADRGRRLDGAELVVSPASSARRTSTASSTDPSRRR